MNSPFVGSHYILSELPIWASIIILYAVTMGVIHVLRDFFEGLPYQIAYSAQVGDIALVGAFLIAATILQRKEPLPLWLICGYFHILVAFVSVGLGITWWALDRPAHWGDIYHHLFVAPLFLYMALTLFPVILINGTKVEKFWALCFVLLWATLVIFDIKYDRMNQRQWLQGHGVKFKQ